MNTDVHGFDWRDDISSIFDILKGRENQLFVVSFPLAEEGLVKVGITFHSPREVQITSFLPGTLSECLVMLAEECGVTEQPGGKIPWDVDAASYFHSEIDWGWRSFRSLIQMRSSTVPWQNTLRSQIKHSGYPYLGVR